MFNSYQEKPLPHFSSGDWHSYSHGINSVTDNIKTTGNNVRQEAAQLRNSVHNTMSWRLKETNRQLGDRVSEVDQWFRNLDRTLSEVRSSTDRLSEAKGELERTVAANLLLLEAAKEILNLRDRRRGLDLVEDEPYYEIKKEVDLIHKINCSLRAAADHDYDHLTSLKQHRDGLESHLHDQEDCLRIDRYHLSLTPQDTHQTSLKPWAAESCSAGTCPVALETWLQGCLDRRNNAEDAVGKGDRASNDSWNMIRKAVIDIDHQRDATQFALRKRRHQTLQERDMLAAQRKDLKAEADRLEREATELERQTAEAHLHLKLAQTRLEGRKSRPGLQLCRDPAAVTLEEEHRHVIESKEYLAQKLRDTKNMLNRTHQHLHEVEDDLQRKERSLAIETSCIEMHETPSKAPYPTDVAWMAPMTSATSSYLVNCVGRGASERLMDRHASECLPTGALKSFNDAERSLAE